MIKSELKVVPVQKPGAKFPCLVRVICGSTQGMIVLADSKTSGIVVVEPPGFPDYSKIGTLLKEMTTIDRYDVWEILAPGSSVTITQQ